MRDDRPAVVRVRFETNCRSSRTPKTSLDPTIHTARTREEAPEIPFQRGDYQAVPRPESVLLDWNLSQHTGGQVIKAVKSVDSGIPVVVMTGSKSEIGRVESSTPAADE